jgi:rhodanese-related sulfurtransferase
MKKNHNNKKLIYIRAFIITIIIISALVLIINTLNEQSKINTPINNTLSYDNRTELLNNETINNETIKKENVISEIIENQSNNITETIEEDIQETNKTGFIKYLLITQAKKYYDNNSVVVIDVSTPLKYSQGHIIGSLNYPLSPKNSTFEDTIKGLDKTKIYLLYSRSDSDTRIASKIFSKLGYNVYVLKGSFGLWVQSGYDFEKQG